MPKENAGTVAGKTKVKVISPGKEIATQPTKMSAISLQMRADAFTTLTLSMLREPFMNSTLKTLILAGMLSGLEQMGYTEKEIEAFRAATGEAIDKFINVNSFMG
jgi:hypothetical protein